MEGYKNAGHGGGDMLMVKDFVQAVALQDPSKLSSDISVSIESHVMGFMAEKSRLGKKMVEVKKTDSNIFNIWPYVSRLKSAKVLSNKIKDHDLIYKIYRDPSLKFEHILLSTEDKNNFVSIIVNKKRRKTIGYSFLDSNEKYDLNKNIA